MTLDEVSAFLKYRFEELKRLNNANKVNAVWLVRDRYTQEKFVKRLIKKTSIPYEELGKLSNPFLPKIFHCVKSDSETTIVIEEYIQGDIIRKFLDDGKFFDEDEVQYFLLQMCDCLKILHKAGIIHRDIKPSNIIRQYDGRIKLIDFDIARIFKPGQLKDTEYWGTEGYAPYEQQKGLSQTDSRSDIYSLGETAKEMLGKNYHGRLEKILDKCTKLEPQKRCQSVDELKNALTVKKYHLKKFLIICAALTLSAGIFYFNSTYEKKIPSEISLPKENFSVQETSAEEISPLKISPKSEENFSFPEIDIPQNPAPVNLPPSTTYEQPITLPPSTPPAQVLPKIETENVTPAENFVRAKYFWNGKQINDWQNNLSEDAQVTHAVNIPAEIWKNNSTPITGTLEITVENFSAQSFAPQVEITFNNDGNLQTKTLSGNILNVGQNHTFRISMNEFRVESLKDSSIGSAEVNIKIFGANIIGSSATITFLFVQKGFPIIEN